MNGDDWTLVATCRTCGSETELFLDLGESPIANNLLVDPSEEVCTYPLGLSQCSSCELVQNLSMLSTEALFGECYPYLSSTSSAVSAHFSDLAQDICNAVGQGSTALEIGSNDGVLQIELKKRGIDCVGVDPATRAVEIARSRGCRSYNMAFDESATQRLKKQIEPVDVAILSNVIAHVPSPKMVLANVAQLIKPSGLVVVEFQSWRKLAEGGSFDMVYHEHHSHFSLGSFCRMANSVGFGVLLAEPIPTQGGSLRAWCRPGRPNSQEVETAIQEEQVRLASLKDKLSASVKQFRASASEFAERFRGRSIAGYGAAAKTVTILSAADGLLAPDYVVDAAPTKIGKFLPVNQTPILSASDLLARKPDVIILFAWNLADEILPILQGFEVWSPIPKLHRIQ